MGEAIIGGLLGGLILSVFIGPVFMYLIEVSITKGVREALFVDLGVFVSDLTCILLSYAFLNQLKFLNEEKAITGIIAGSIFILFGLAYLFKSGKSPEHGKDVGQKVRIKTGKRQVMNVVKGFMLNMINPSVLVYWVGVMMVAVRDFGTNGSTIFAFFTALLITFFTIDVLKIVGARQLRKFLKPAIIEKINVFSGVAFICLGVFSLVMGIIKL